MHSFTSPLSLSPVNSGLKMGDLLRDLLVLH